jgi:predicted transcriptional regulator
MKLNKMDESVIAALKEGKELTLAEITDQSGQPSKKVFKSLRKLFEAEIIDSNERKYKLIVDVNSIKARLAKKADDDSEKEE